MKLLLALIVALVMSPFSDAKEIARVEDGHKDYVTAFGDVPDDVINSVRSQYPDAHFRKISESDPIASRYTSYVQFPAIVVQKADGTVIYKKSSFGGRCGPFRPCPTPAEPAVAPVAPPVLEPPAFVPDTPEPANDPNVLAMLLTAGAGAAGGAGRKVYSELKG